MENRKGKAGRALILAGMAVCLLPISRVYYHSVRHREQQEELREMVTEKDV